MSFRLRIVLITTALITLLSGIGGTMLIHSNFQNSLKKEEEVIVNTNEMILRMVQYVGRDGYYVADPELVNVIYNLCQQDAISMLQLVCDGDTVYTYENGNSILKNSRKNANPKENQVLINYFALEDKDYYMQSTVRFSINGKEYDLDICRNLMDIYQAREEQLRLFRNIFVLLTILGVILSWGLATLITRHLRKLTKAATEIGRGNLSYRSHIQSDDEIGKLAMAFDHMAERLEQNITLLKETAEQKERFMEAFTHELKTPMTSIIGYSDMLRTQKLGENDRREALDYIFSEGKRLENLSLKMLDLFVADKKEIELELCSPARTVEYAVSHLKKDYLESGIQIEISAEAGECMLDAELFQTLLINLLDNARKSMEQGGRIKVRIKMTESGCELCVTDEGKGIPKESLKHVTEAFYRVDKARAGSRGNAGLGLALCDKIVRLHNGTLEIESTEGVGTVVTALLNGGRDEEKTT